VVIILHIPYENSPNSPYSGQREGHPSVDMYSTLRWPLLLLFLFTLLLLLLPLLTFLVIIEQVLIE